MTLGLLWFLISLALVLGPIGILLTFWTDDKSGILATAFWFTTVVQLLTLIACWK